MSNKRLTGLLLASSLLVLMTAATPFSTLAASASAGSPLYQVKCAMCHGKNGVAILPGTPNFSKGERLEKPDNELMQSVKNGKNAMPPFKGMLTDAQVGDILAYIRKF